MRFVLPCILLALFIRCETASAAQPLAIDATSFTANTHHDRDQQRPAVARAPDGSFVVVWDSDGTDDNVDDVYARRYDAQGMARGDEFRVNVVTRNRQYAPRIAMDGAGGFIVVWLSNSQDELGLEIYARRYDASGTALGGEFRVDTTGRPAYSQFDVAMANDGSFVITWIDRSNILGLSALQQQTLDAQRYASDGHPIGSVITVYRTDLFAVRTPSVAVDGEGNFVVAWFIGPGSIWARRYDANGRAQGLSFRVSPVNPQIVVDRPQISRNMAGDFAIVWETSGVSDLADTGIYARLYAANGRPRTAAMRIDNRLLRNPEIAVAGTGFVVAAHSDAIYAQCIGIGGELASAYRVDDSPTRYTPLFASVSSDGSGNPVFAWQNLGTEAYGREIQARRWGFC